MNRRTLLKTILGTVTALTTFKVTADEPSATGTDNFFAAIGLNTEEYKYVVSKVYQEIGSDIAYLDINLSISTSEEYKKYGEWLNFYSRTFVRENYAFEVSYYTQHIPNEQPRIYVYGITKQSREYHDKINAMFNHI